MSKASNVVALSERELPSREVISARTDLIQRELIRVAGLLRVAAGALQAIDDNHPRIMDSAENFSVLDVQTVIEAAIATCDREAEACDSVILFRPEP